MFIDSVNSENQPVAPNSETWDLDALESVLFWSLLFLFEAGETRRFMEFGFAKSKVFETISEFITAVHPYMYKHLQTLGVSSFESLGELIIGHFSNVVPVNKCSDLWLAALAASDFLDFMECMVVSCLFFNIANMKKNPLDLIEVIRESFRYVNHRYLVASSLMLDAKSEDLFLSID
jgi:hypothetical protein